MIKRKTKEKGTRAIPILILGVLSMYFAELYSGASTIWFIDPWRVIITFPLYMLHCLLLLNIAVKADKVSLPKLYILGNIFGLYESWITTVLWNGYINADPNAHPIFGLLLGVAWNEFITLVFFWHPIMSFCLPVIIYEMLAFDSGGSIFGSHLEFIRKSKRNGLIMTVIIIFGAAFLSTGAGYNPTVVLISAGGTLLIILFLLKGGRKRQFGIPDLMLTKKGYAVVIVYLALIYVFTGSYLASLGYYPDNPISYISIATAYIVFIVIFLTVPRDRTLLINLETVKNQTDEHPPNENRSDAAADHYTCRDFIKTQIIFIILGVIFSSLGGVLAPFFTLFYLSIFLSGIPVYIYMMKKAFSTNKQ